MLDLEDFKISTKKKVTKTVKEKKSCHQSCLEKSPRFTAVTVFGTH